jgi:hypothetical protein
MSTERWFWIKVEVEEENDGATYLRRGPENSSEILSLEKAASIYGKNKLVAVLRSAADHLERGAPFHGRV